MEKILSLGCKTHSLLNATRAVDFLGPLALRIYLAPVFILAGWGKLKDLEGTAYYFGEYLGLAVDSTHAYIGFASGATDPLYGDVYFDRIANQAPEWIIPEPATLTMLALACGGCLAMMDAV